MRENKPAFGEAAQTLVHVIDYTYQDTEHVTAFRTEAAHFADAAIAVLTDPQVASLLLQGVLPYDGVKSIKICSIEDKTDDQNTHYSISLRQKDGEDPRLFFRASSVRDAYSHGEFRNGVEISFPAHNDKWVSITGNSRGNGLHDLIAQRLLTSEDIARDERLLDAFSQGIIVIVDNAIRDDNPAKHQAPEIAGDLERRENLITVLQGAATRIEEALQTTS